MSVLGAQILRKFTRNVRGIYEKQYRKAVKSLQMLNKNSILKTSRSVDGWAVMSSVGLSVLILYQGWKLHTLMLLSQCLFDLSLTEPLVLVFALGRVLEQLGPESVVLVREADHLFARLVHARHWTQTVFLGTGLFPGTFQSDPNSLTDQLIHTLKQLIGQGLCICDSIPCICWYCTGRWLFLDYGISMNVGLCLKFHLFNFMNLLES